MTEQFTADDVLVAAGAELDRRGWVRGVLVHPHGNVCALGALFAGLERLRQEHGLHAAVLDVDGLLVEYPRAGDVPIVWDDPQFVVAREACTAVLVGERREPEWEPPGSAVATWNNNVAQGPEDLHRLFEKARKILAERAAV